VTAAARTVLVASITAIRSDGRILRQIDTLLAAGHRVIAVGAAGGPPHLAEATGTLRFVDIPPLAWTRFSQLGAVAGFSLGGLASIERLADTYPSVARLRAAVLDVAQTQGGPQFAIANDWQALPAILALHRRHATPFHYDTHEHAVSEHSHNRIWRLAFPRLIERIERIGVSAAQSVSSPSTGISADLARSYGGATRIGTIRNVTNIGRMVPRAVGTPVRVLYHGLFKEDRGLIGLVRSVRDWPERFVLDLRGKAMNPAFGAALEAAVAEADGRVQLHPMAEQGDLIALTNQADIGIFLPDVSSRQLRHALPNKVFEYLHAGLMLIVPQDCDMADFVAETGAGLAIDPRHVAQTLAGLGDDDIARFKAAAHRASEGLTWEAEGAKMLALMGI